MGGKHLFKLTLACLLALIGWVNQGWATDVADRCQQLYENGQYEQAFPVCSKAAEQGNASAQFNLGLMYAQGEGVQQDYVKAVKWFRKAAEQGDAKAQFNLGVTYRNGEGVPQDYAGAVKWYRKAAEQGYAIAQSSLGWIMFLAKASSRTMLRLQNGTARQQNRDMPKPNTVSEWHTNTAKAFSRTMSRR